MKAFPSDKISFAKMIISDSDRVESIVEKKRKCWLPAISSFPIMFTKIIFLRVIQSQVKSMV